jgi:light-harvesting complex II chlorophyll a/b binding protein 6
MAVACSASVSQLTSIARSSSLVSSSRAQSLRSCPQVAFFGVSNGSRVVAMATKKVSKKSGRKPSWLPGVNFGSLTDPEWLDGSLPGDYGFDPLGLGKDPSALKWYREAEIIHGRWAMTAVVGIFIGQSWSGIPWFEAGADPSAVAPFSFGSLLGTQLFLMGWVETKRWIDFLEPGSQLVDWATPWSRTAENFGNSTGLQGYPGGKFFDPLGLAGEVKGGKYVPNYGKLSRLQLAEIKHARIAMLAMLIFYFEAGKGFTPLGALGL